MANESDARKPFRSDPARGFHAFKQMAALSLAMLAALVFILTFQLLPSRYQLNEGDVARYDIKSPQQITYVSQIQTKEERDQAEAVVSPVMVPEDTILNQQKGRLLEAGRTISDIRQELATLQQKRDSIQKVPNLSLPAPIIDDILGFDDPSWHAALSEAAVVLEAVLGEKITDQQVAEAKAKLPDLVRSQLPPAEAAVAASLAENFVQANQIVDQDATAKAKQAARDAVQPVRLTIERGEMILRDGDIVKATDIEKLDAAGLRKPNLQWQDVLGTMLLVTVLVICLSYYLLFFEPGTLANGRRLALLGFVIVLAILVAKLMMPGREMWAYLFMPTAAAAMLISTLLSPELAVVTTVLISVLVGFITNLSLEMTTLSLAAGIVGLLGARRIERMQAFFLTGLAVALSNFAVILAFELFAGDLDTSRLLTLMALAVANGGLSAALTFGTFSFLGHIFGITTSLGLMELAHPTHPLFHRLMTNAPGTYHHSMVVANLSERAAEQIGADGLLCRVGAYYHDIGKVVRPYFFIENQEGENIHDRLEPRNSAQIIAAHVKDGLELARRFGLPSKIHDIIEQHHGTHIVAYFYQQACQNASGESVDEQEFRYPGPRPQTRETAIMMLADSVEAAVRSSPDHSSEYIARVVNKVIADRLADGQLDECDLTLRDLDKIRSSFITVLQGIFHPRIEYPETTTVQIPAAENKVRQIDAG